MPTPKEYVATDGTRTWRVRLRAHGRATSETFHTKRQAEQFCKLITAIGAEAAIAERNRRDAASSEYVPTLREWLPKHIEQLTGIEDRTRIDYLALANRTFLKYLGDHPLDGITRDDVAKMINALERQPALNPRTGKPTGRTLSAKSIANAHGLMSSAMASAVMREIIGTNPCHKMRLPRTGEEERRVERFLTHDEYHALYEAFPAEHRAQLLTMFGTGVRWSELTALQVFDVKPTRPPSLRVERAWKRTPGNGMRIAHTKSGKSRRTVILPDQVMAAIEPLLARDSTAWLFAAPRGGHVHYGRWRSDVWVPACVRAGLTDPQPTPHDARHSHASWLIEQGATLEMVQDQLGHESILTTRKVYGHLQPAMRTALAEAATRAMAMGAPTLEIEGPG